MPALDAVNRETWAEDAAVPYRALVKWLEAHGARYTGCDGYDTGRRMHFTEHYELGGRRLIVVLGPRHRRGDATVFTAASVADDVLDDAARRLGLSP